MHSLFPPLRLISFVLPLGGIYNLKKDLSLTFSVIFFRAKMSLFGTTSGFGTGGTSMFGSTTTDNHNPMKVPHWTSWGCPEECRAGSPTAVAEEKLIVGSLLWGGSSENLSGCFLKHWSIGTWCPVPLTAPVTRITWGLACIVESESLQGGKEGRQ